MKLKKESAVLRVFEKPAGRRFCVSLSTTAVSNPPMIPRAALACTKPEKADKRRRSRSVEHDVRAKQTKVCDAERTRFQTPIFILVTSRQRRVITRASNYLKADGQLKLAAVSPPADELDGYRLLST